MGSPSGSDVQARVDSAFDAVLALPEAERAAWIDRHFADAPELARRTHHLVAAERRSRTLFDTLLDQRDRVFGAAVPELDHGPANDPRIGRRYGPWKVTRHIGSGGMSEVYAVTRADGRYEQLAALKILCGGGPGPQAKALFLRERRMLANLNHPALVRIIDGGETATGAPWLVMEQVEGQPITAFAQQRQLPLAKRLELVAQCADALQAAHECGVLHGDIKPDHLVMEDNGNLRLLDFGIAQLLDEAGTADEITALTPSTASPEQFAGRRLTTASDIYQLGRVLQELVGESGANRELAAIVSVACAPEPEARYRSAAALAADLRKLVRGEATAALPDTAPRALLRLARQNRLASALALAAVVALAGWGVTASLGAARIERERQAAVLAADRAERGRQVMVELFRRADPLELDALGLVSPATIAALDEALAGARTRLADDPALLGQLSGWAARLHRRAGDDEEAARLAADAVAFTRAADGEQSGAYAAALAFAARLAIERGDAEQGNADMVRALALAERAGSADPATLDTLLLGAWAAEGEWERQLGLFRRAAALAETLGSDNARIEAGAGIGRALDGLGRPEEADRQLRAVLAKAEAAYGPDHPRLTLPLSDLGRIAEHRGNPEQAALWHRRARDIALAAYGPNSAEVLSHRNNLALALQSAGDDAGAAEELRQIYRQRLTHDGAGALATAEVAQNLAAVLVRAGAYREAETYLATAEAGFARSLPAGNPRRAFPALTRSEMRIGQRRWREAEAEAAHALAGLESALPPGHFALATARCRIATARLAQGQRTALPMLRNAVAVLDAKGSAAPERYRAPCRAALKRFAH